MNKVILAYIKDGLLVLSSKPERILSERNSYVEVEVTHTIPGVSAIRFRCAEEQMVKTTSWFLTYLFLTCEARLLDTGGMSTAST